MKREARYQKGDKIGGRYRIHKALMGGMGEVYLCFDEHGQYPYALKTFQRQHQSDKLVDIFSSEVNTWVSLEKHTNVVRCFGLEHVEAVPFMLLEWVMSDEQKGTDLRSWIQHKAVDYRQALDFTLDICRGLRHAQTKIPGIVHRDLKPDNVLIDRNGIAKITDFGLAKVAQTIMEGQPDDYASSGQHLSNMGGTPLYMAPEQWLGKQLDIRTDMYAVGCILYELITGHWVYVGQTHRELRDKHLNAEIPVITNDKRLPELTVVNQILKRCLAKDATERYANIDELIAELAKIYEVSFNESPQVETTAQEFTATDYMNRGITLDILEQYEQANADYNRSIELDSNNADVFNNRGYTYLVQGQFDKAIADFSEAIRLNPKLRISYTNRGSTYLRLGQFDKAIENFQAITQMEPDFAEAYYNLGVAYLQLKNLETAMVNFHKARSLGDPDAVSAINQVSRMLTDKNTVASQQATRPHFDPTKLQRSLDTSEDYVARGVNYANTGHPKHAIQDFTTAIQLNPNSPIAYLYRADTYARLSELQLALNDYTIAIQLDATNPMVFNDRGYTYQELGQIENAIKDYDDALLIDPTFALAYSNRGAIYNNIGKKKEAMENYNQALHYNPYLPQVLYERGRLSIEWGKYDAGIEDLDRATQLGHPQSAQVAGLARIDVAMAGFHNTHSIEDMREVTRKYAYLGHPDFVHIIEGVTRPSVPESQIQQFDQRLNWLKQIITERG